jgi:hypothetical protein
MTNFAVYINPGFTNKQSIFELLINLQKEHRVLHPQQKKLNSLAMQSNRISCWNL